jgi:glycosyltransferase involved in cell wall biosynthesis
MSGGTRVLFVARYFYPAYSGPALRFQRYAPGLQQRGISFEVFSQSTEQTVSGHSSVSDETLVEGIPVHYAAWLHDSAQSNRTFFRLLVQYCQQNRPDVLHFISLPLGVIPQLAQLRRLGIPMIFTHTLLGQLSKNPLKRWLQKRYWRLPFQQMDHIVVSSSVMRDELAGLGVTRPITVIPNGVNLRRFHPVNDQQKKDLRRLYRLPLDATIATFVGPIVKRKGVDLLIEAWANVIARHPQAFLLLVGPKPSETIQQGDMETTFIQQLDKLMESPALHNTVLFTGKSDYVEVYYQISDIFVFPSAREGMPNVVPEAFACGLPCILTPFFGLPAEFGEPDKHYFLVERNPDSLAAALNDLLESPDKRRTLGENARQWIVETMKVELSVDYYAKLYKHVYSM